MKKLKYILIIFCFTLEPKYNQHLIDYQIV